MERAATRERNEGRLSEAPEGTAAKRRRRAPETGGSMARLTGLLTAAAILGLTAASGSAQVLPTPVRQQAHLMLGGIQGVVVDDRGGPLAGAMVSAFGITSAMATTDGRGR